MRTLPWLLVAVVSSPVAVRSAEPPTPHDRAFWQRILDDDGKLPAGESAPVLVGELSQLLGASDPRLRDGVAYGLLSTWIYRDKLLGADELRARVAEWSANLRAGIGETGTDTVLRRSFSALMLSVVAAHDLAAPFLTRAEFDALLSAALDYLAAERDVRGYDPQKGWMHSAAHTADLLKFLARSPHLKPADQGRVLSAIAAKLDSCGPLTHGEDERLAHAVLSLVLRADFDAAAFRAWHGGYPARRKALAGAQPLDPESYAALQNCKHVLVSLYALLAQVKEPTPALVAARDELLTTLGPT